MKKFYTFLLLFCLGNSSIGQAPIIEYQLLVSELSEPLDIANAADGSNRLFIVQRGGLIRIWDGNAILPNAFLNVTPLLSLSSNERGLLSLAFHPDYKTNRYFFIFYTNTAGALTVARYRTLAANPNLADAASGVVLLTIPHPGQNNHNGAKLLFGKDGFLYFGTGDGGGGNDPANNAQNGASLLGKMLRIDVNDFTDITPPLYSIPADNPYITDGTIANEIIALGLRNPWRWSFDRLTGDMWIGDVGQGAREEVDFRRSDSILHRTNYGWRCLEGSIINPNASVACAPPANNVFPIFDYPHNAGGGFVITGGHVYRGAEYPAMYGYYITTDYATGNIWLIREAGGGGWEVTPQIINKLTNVSSYGEGENGALYAVRLTNGSANSGALYKVITGTALPAKLLSFTARDAGNVHELNWKITAGNTGDLYIVERRNAGENNFKEVARKTATEDQLLFSINLTAATGDNYYRLKMMDNNGTITYSPVIFLKRNKQSTNIFSIFANGENASLLLHEPAQSLQVINAGGVVIYRQSLNGQTGMISLPGNFARGIVFVRVVTENGTEVKKLMK